MAGRLIIAGGNITHAEKEIFSAFVQAGEECINSSQSGGSAHPHMFVLVPGASENPEKSYAYFKEVLQNLGVPEASLACAKVSVRKKGWERGAWDQEQVKLAEQAVAFWFSGGDQNAIMEALQDEHGRDSPFLELMRTRNAQGAVIGGTSAGAAIMSNPMIGGGTSFGALALPEALKPADTEISDALYVRQGLGFFPRGIVDQHFDVRARTARLLRAVSLDPHRRTWGFGIAEDTALVWDPDSAVLRVIGSAGVYVFDTRDARWQKSMNRYGVTDAVLHYLTRGDSLNLATLSLDFGNKVQLESGKEYYRLPQPSASGVLSPYANLADFISNMLIDNAWDALFCDNSEPGNTFQSYSAGIQEGGAVLHKGLSTITEWRHAKSFLIGFGANGDRLEWEIRCKRSKEDTRGYTAGSGVVSFENVKLDIIPG